MGMNLLFILAVFALQDFGVFYVMMFILFFGGFLFMVPAYFIQRGKLIKKNDHQQQLLFPGSAYRHLKNKRNAIKVAQRRSAARVMHLQKVI